MQIPVIAGYFLYAEQLNARMLGGVALVVAAIALRKAGSSATAGRPTAFTAWCFSI